MVPHSIFFIPAQILDPKHSNQFITSNINGFITSYQAYKSVGFIWYE